MVKLESKGAQSSARAFVPMLAELQAKLNGLTLGDAVSRGIITNDANFKFVVVTRNYPNGTSYDRLCLQCNQGFIPLSGPLEAGIEEFVDQLGDLVIKQGVSWEDDATKVSHPYFHLQKPSGAVTETVTDAVIEGVTVA